jgi:hypothetical protein
MNPQPVIVPAMPRTRMFGLQLAAKSIACCSGGGNVLVWSDAAATTFSGLAERSTLTFWHRNLAFKF